MPKPDPVYQALVQSHVLRLYAELLRTLRLVEPTLIASTGRGHLLQCAPVIDAIEHVEIIAQVIDRADLPLEALIDSGQALLHNMECKPT